MDHMRTLSIQELESYVDMSEYGKKEQEKINAILEESEEQIMASNKQYEINQIKADAEGDINEIHTIKQNRKAGRAKINKLVDMKKYRPEQRQQIRNIQKKYKIKHCTVRIGRKHIFDRLFKINRP